MLLKTERNHLSKLSMFGNNTLTLLLRYYQTGILVTLYFDSPSVDTLQVISRYSVACQQCVSEYSTEVSVDCQYVLLQQIINQFSTICSLSQHLLS